MRLSRLRGRAGVGVVAAIVLVVGCGSSDSSTSSDATMRSEASTSTGAPAGSDHTSTTVAAPAELDDLTGTLIINRQRDLIDRGLINVQLVNGSDLVMEMTDRRLLADHFATDPAARRVSPIPNGRPINVQVPYGAAVDCTSTAPVRAELVFTFTVDGETVPREGSVSLAGTEILDSIRAEQCAGAAFAEITETEFGQPVVDGEQVNVDLSIRADADAPPIEILAGHGTILVGADLPTAPIDVGNAETVVAVVFDVNRCDPHAMAEVTKRYGLELRVAIDGAAPLPIDVDVTAIEPALAAIVANCQERAGTEH